MKRRAVFLDRDGVINEPVIRDGKPYPPSHPNELFITPGAELSLSRLKHNGFFLLVVTNQPDIRRGKTSLAAVEQLHALLSSQLPIDDFFICAHDDADACVCRKPLPGLIHDAALQYDIQIEKSYLIGDRWRDIDAGAAAGCRTILIDRQYNERRPAHNPDKIVPSLAAAVEWILQQEEN